MDLLAQTDGQSLLTWLVAGAGIVLAIFSYWITCHHLPSKDAQMVEIVTVYNERTDRKDAHIQKLVDTTLTVAEKAQEQLLTSSAAARSEFKQALDKVVDHCAEEASRASDSWARGLEPKIREVVADENQKAIAKVLERQREMERSKREHS